MFSFESKHLAHSPSWSQTKIKRARNYKVAVAFIREYSV
jgi:hypothetical protein